MSSQNDSEVESLLMSPCWGQGQNGGQDHQYLLEGHKLLLEHDLDSLPSDSEVQKGSMDVLDTLLLSSQPINTSLAELKPLPPFTGYTGHLSINGISGHHYHAIANRLPEENNNYSHSSGYGQDGQTVTTTDHNIVSSSTCLPDSVLNPDGSDSCLQDVKLFSDNDSKMYSVADSCVMGGGGQGPDSVSSVRIYADSKDLSEYDMSSIEDIAAIIGSAIADTTVPSRAENEDASDTRDSWMDLDAWIDGTCVQQDGKLIVAQHQDSINEFILPHSPIGHTTTGSTLQSLLTHGYMPLLQNRLQNGPPSSGPPIKVEAPTSTSYCGELITTSTSPPGSVVSTTDNMILNGGGGGGGRYNMQSAQSHHYQVGNMNSNGGNMKPDGLCSPDIMGSYHTPHTTTASTPTGPKNKRSRSQKKAQQAQQQAQAQMNAHSVSAAAQAASASINFQSSPNDLSGLLGKEKPVHRCNICNRGFLNKSNIKVHLRTHTGEKPFRCEVCSKAFRQKAHLIKHQQIHKRIGRD